MRFNAHDDNFLRFGRERGDNVGHVHAESCFVDVGAGFVLGVQLEVGAGGAEGFAVLGRGVDGEGEDAAGLYHFLSDGDASGGAWVSFEGGMPKGRGHCTFLDIPR